VETLLQKARLYSLAVDRHPSYPPTAPPHLGLNEWEETAVLIHLLTELYKTLPEDQTWTQSVVNQIWMCERLSYLKRTYPYVGQSIFRSAPAWWKDL